MMPSGLNMFAQISVIYYLVVSASSLGPECKYFGTCTQKCKVVAGTSRCLCMEGYVLTDNTTCALKDPVWKLVYATKNQVVSVIIPGMVRSNLTTNSDGDFKSVTSDTRNNVVYWTDATLERGAVYKTSVVDNAQPDLVVNVGISNPSVIAFDWITGNLYFIDLGSIVVCSQNPTRCALVVQENGIIFDGIALHPNGGTMFWTKPGEIDNLRFGTIIMTAGMDGSTPTSIISTGHIWPNSFTVDEANSRIYWAPYWENKIESSRMDGSDRNGYVVSHHPFAINILENRIFWSSLAGEEIISANKFTGKDERAIIPNCSAEAFSLMHLANQPKLRVNPCEDLKSNHICVLSATGAQHLCPAGMVEDGNICVGHEKAPKLLLAEGDKLYAAQLNIIGKYNFEKILLPSQIKVINALVYNPINKTLIISDKETRKIVEYMLKSKVYRVLVDDANVTSMDFDMISENLIWIDGAAQTIEVLSLRTLARMVLRRNVENPRDIVFAPDRGTLYLSKTVKMNSKRNVTVEHEEIHIIFLDGESNDTLFYQCMDCTSPIKLAYGQKLGGVIATLLQGNKATIRGESRGWKRKAFSLLASGYSDHPVMDVVKIGNQIFWVDQSNQVTFVNPNQNDIFHKAPAVLNTNNSSLTFRKTLAIINPGILDDIWKIREKHDCSPSNMTKRKLCSHICLPTGINNVGECWCSVGFHLDADGLTCIENARKTETDNTGVYLILIVVGVGITVLIAYFWKNNKPFPMLPKSRNPFNRI